MFHYAVVCGYVGAFGVYGVDVFLFAVGEVVVGTVGEEGLYLRLEPLERFLLSTARSIRICRSSIETRL